MSENRHKAGLCMKVEALSSQVSGYLSPTCANMFTAHFHRLDVSWIRIKRNVKAQGYQSTSANVGLYAVPPQVHGPRELV